jgi:hypothetical protein
MEVAGYGRSPSVCVDGSGRWWIAWISWDHDGEIVRVASRVQGGEWSAPLACCERKSRVTAATLAPAHDGIFVAWIDGGDPEEDGLKIRSVSASGRLGGIRLVAPSRLGPSAPALACDGSLFLLAWTTRELGGRRLEAAFGSESGSPLVRALLSLGSGFHLRPAATMAGGRGFVAWERLSRHGSRILGRWIDREAGPLPVAELCGHDRGIASMAAVAGSPDGGVWVAWQSDVDPDSGAGLVRWIDMALVSADGHVSVPRAPMPGVDRNGKGTDQGFEAPSLASFADGSLVVVGRGSQGVYRQSLGTDGWSERQRIDEDGWQCRGRRFAAYPAAPGEILVAGREKDGVAIRHVSLGDGARKGPPELVPLVARGAPLPSLPPRPPAQRSVAGRAVLFGDLHQHTAASDGTGTAEEAFHRARLRYGDDMAAISDHESFLGKRTPPGEWHEACRVADEWYEPGAFVTLHAFEWTGAMHPGPGHKVVYLPPDGGPVLSREDEATATSRGLVAEARKVGAIVIPHHVGWTGADMASHDPEVQPCFEIVSCHGAYERQGVGPIPTRGDDKAGQFVGDALDKGLRFGFIGGSDGHGLNWHHGLCRVKDSHRSGLTGVFAEEASRQGVIEALRRRRCYATSGAKIGLWFEVDGRPMGESIVAADLVPFRVVVDATVDVSTLVLVTNGGHEIPLEPAGLAFEARGSLDPPMGGGWAYYYVRLVQSDGEVAWSSPIWLDAPAPA